MMDTVAVLRVQRLDYNGKPIDDLIEVKLDGEVYVAYNTTVSNYIGEFDTVMDVAEFFERYLAATVEIISLDGIDVSGYDLHSDYPGENS